MTLAAMGSIAPAPLLSGLAKSVVVDTLPCPLLAATEAIAVNDVGDHQTT